MSAPLYACPKLPKIISITFLLLLWAKILVVRFGIDRLTTATWFVPTSVCIAVPLGATVSTMLLLNRFREKGFLKEDQLSKTSKNGDGWNPYAAIAAGIGFAWVFTWLVGSLLGVIAQHIPGKITKISAVVVSLNMSNSLRAGCQTTIVASPKSGGDAIQFCLVTTNNRLFHPKNFQPGEQINLELKMNFLGIVVEKASRSEGD